MQPTKVQEIQEIDDILDGLPTNEQKTNNIIPENRTVPAEELEDVNRTSMEMQDMRMKNSAEQASNLDNINNDNQNEPKITEAKRGRGRPRKVQPEGVTPIPVVKRGRGRPRKASPEVVGPNEQTSILDEIKPIESTSQIQPKATEDVSTPVNLFELGEDDEPTKTTVQDDNSFVLPGLEDDEPVMSQETQTRTPQTASNESIAGQTVANEVSPFELYNEEDKQKQVNQNEPIQNLNNQQNFAQNQMQNTTPNALSQGISNLLTREKKVVAFVGTSKNGTSFLVNNIAEMLSQKGINTAILDLTKNRNAYYIYTENEESLRKVAYSCIENLRSGRAQGIEVHKNLTVYTTLPDEEQNINDYSSILQTLAQNYSLVILDCDFETDIGYFKEAQELYLVQSFDILTIQPLTAFLRNLKAKNVLNPEKLRIVLNKAVRLRSISEKTIIGGMAFYNDPAMSFMTELFNRDLAVYCTIPFEEQAYSKYLEGLVNCKISLNEFSKVFMTALSKLADMVYPLINNMKKNGNSNYNNYNKFPNSMNSTLDKMKNNY